MNLPDKKALHNQLLRKTAEAKLTASKPAKRTLIESFETSQDIPSRSPEVLLHEC